MSDHLCCAELVSCAVDAKVKKEGGLVMLNFWRAFIYRLTFKMTGAFNFPAFALPARLMSMLKFSASCT
ncbi:MAG: hypothetical protein EBT43_00260 [Methylocystaceae bacterium]|nr:hypothetical protein [Methylocystaceae bacterium]